MTNRREKEKEGRSITVNTHYIEQSPFNTLLSKIMNENSKKKKKGKITDCQTPKCPLVVFVWVRSGGRTWVESARGRGSRVNSEVRSEGMA